jgi:hypothetical protein
MLFAALASVVIATCYDGDTCTTTTGEMIRHACIDTPELQGKGQIPSEPLRHAITSDHWSSDAPLASAESPRIAMAAPWRNYLLIARTCSNSW